MFRFFVSLALLFSFSSALYSASFPADPASQEEVATPVPSLPDLLEQSRELSREAFELESDSVMRFDTAEIYTHLERIKERAGSLQLDLDQLKNGQKNLDEQVFILRSSLKNENALIKRQVEPVLQALDTLHEKNQYWVEKQSLWEEWYGRVQKGNSAPSLRDVMSSTIETIKKSIKDITEKSNELIQTVQQAVAIETDIFQMQLRIDHRIESNDTLFPTGNITPLFTPAFFRQLRVNGWKGLSKGVQESTQPEWQLFKDNGQFIFLQISMAVLIALLLLYIRSEKTLKSLVFVRRPISAGIFASLLFLRVFEPVSPPIWILAETVLTWIVFLSLFSLYSEKRTHRALMCGLALFHILIQLFWVVKVPFVISRLVIFLTSLGASAALILIARRKNETHWFLLCVKLLALVFAAITIMELIGFTDLSKTLYRLSINTLSVFAKAWLLYHISKGAIEWLLKKLASEDKYISEERLPIVSKLCRIVLYLFFAVCVTIYLLVGWGIFDSSNEAFKNILSWGFVFGNIQLSVSHLLQAVFLAALTLTVSVVIQSVLIESVFPSINVPKEVGFSISRLIHYCVLAVGVLLVLLSLGVSFTNLAIFGGALGVGLGLGLQEIVKNFAAGIIILVERPIKIGDLVDFENITCRVEKIGLRSTLVRSLDGIFKVIPNNDLIVNPVTNWTHSKKRLRKSCTIGVAYGSDVNLTMRLLKEAAEEHESVLKNPEPEIYFEEFGDSSLNFQLRYWVKDVSLIKIVPSEVNQMIERKLAEAGIEIPFPQMDVHFFNEAKNES